MKKLAAGIDIGGTNSVFGLTDSEGRIYAKGTIRTDRYPDVDKFTDDLCVAIDRSFANLGAGFELCGIGIGAPNANYFKGVIEDAPNLLWKGEVRLVEKIKARFSGIDIVMTNDAKAAAIGEMTYGAARGMSDFIVVTLGTGVGSGFVVNGKLLLGHDSFAGELGHVIVCRGGRECGCGRRGCLETYASATGIRRTVFELLAESDADSTLRNVTYRQLNGAMITEAADAGDPIALEAYRRTGIILGEALANAVAITSPEAIFLFGGLARAGNYIFEPVKTHMEANLMGIFKGKVKLLPSGIDDMNAAVLGAASLVWHLTAEKN